MSKDSELVDAVKARDPQKVEKLLKEGANPNHVLNDNQRLVSYALSEYSEILRRYEDHILGRKEKLEPLFPGATYSSNIRELFDAIKEMLTVFYNEKLEELEASSYHYKKIIDALIDGGADINFKNESNETLLHLAIKQSDTNIGKYLLTKGAIIDVNTTSRQVDNKEFDPRQIGLLQRALASTNYYNVKAFLVSTKDINQSTNLPSDIVNKINSYLFPALSDKDLKRFTDKVLEGRDKALNKTKSK